MRTSSTAFRRLGAAAVLALVATATVACGGDDGDDQGGSGDRGSAGDVEKVSVDQLETAALVLENFTGDDWEEVPHEETEGDGPGCFGDISRAIDEIEPELEVNRTFEDDTIGLPSVDSAVASFADTDQLAATFDEVQDLLTGCTAITETTEDGTVYDLAVTSDETTLDGADDQINITLDGTVTPAEGERTNFSQHASMIRIGNLVTQVSTLDLGDESAMHAALAQIALDRLTAVLDGEEPATTAAPEAA